MKKIFFLQVLATIIALSVTAQKNKSAGKGYEVTGNIKAFSEPFIYLTGRTYDAMSKNIMDSAAVANGKFKFSGKLSHPSLVQLFSKDRSKALSFYLENSKIKIEGDAMAFKAAKVSGSLTNDEYIELLDSKKEVNAAMQNLGKNLSKEQMGNPEAMTKLNEDVMKLINESNRITMQFIAQHPKSKMAANELFGIMSIEPYNDLLAAYNSFDESIKNSGIGKKMTEQLGILKKSAVGQQAPDFTQNDVDGKPVTLSSFKGNYVLLDFWASWCGPCRAENPNVLKAYNKFRGKGFTVISVSIDSKEEAWKKAIKDDGMPWVQLSDLKGINNVVALAYGVQAVPATLLIDPNGKIIGRNVKGTALQEKLAEIFQ